MNAPPEKRKRQAISDTNGVASSVADTLFLHNPSPAGKFADMGAGARAISDITIAGQAGYHEMAFFVSRPEPERTAEVVT